MDTVPLHPIPATEGGWQPPAEFDEYRLVRPLGRGSGGWVFLAQDQLLDRPVSVKFLRAQDEAAIARFMIEARAAARVQHPNVATLYRVGRLEARPFLVSEYVRGHSLDKIPRPVDWETTLSFAIDLARGLGAAHRHGVLHRDIKPANAILTEAGEVKLLDFGLAKLVDPRLDKAVPPEGPVALSVVQPPPELDRTMETPDRTAHGAIIGTPCYMSPEAWRGEPATPRTDLYSLGILLYELCAGAPPYRELKPIELFYRVQNDGIPPLQHAAPQVPDAFAAVIDRCTRGDPSQRFASADELLDALETIAAAGAPTEVPAGNPYRGLQPFEAEHRGVFFGRRREIASVVDRLRADPLVVLTGDSGVGKSSLCLAGVLPSIAEGALGDGRSYRVARLVPGRSPVSALAATLAQAAGLREDDVEQAIRERPESLWRDVRAQLGATRGILVYVDQLEELVTLSSPESAALVSAALGHACSGIAGVKLLATARSDFLTRLAALGGLGEHVPRALLLLRGLTAEEAREAVVGPARAAGGKFESEALVDVLVRAASSGLGSLPLVQFALAELWEARDQASGTISSATLEAIGGVDGALARHAEAVLAALLPAQRHAAREVLLRLVTAEGTRARRTELELAGQDPNRKEALEALVRGRLLVAREAETATAYEIAHEALLRGCTTLATWLGEEAETRAVRERLALAANDWERHRRPSDVLWPARALLETTNLKPDGLSQRERDFLAASRRAVRLNRVKRAAMIAGFVVALASVWGGVLWRSNRARTRAVEAKLAEAKAALDEARTKDRELAALRATAFAAFDSGQRTSGERTWTKVVSQAAEVERAYLRADEEHERALVLGDASVQVRSAFADLLLERATLAERDRRHSLLDLFLQRLRLYDLDGARARAFLAPATVVVKAEPGRTRLEVERFETVDGKLKRIPVEAPERGPLHLPPGSYLVTARADGYLPVRYPLLLTRGERRELNLSLPRPEQVPPGFVYIPAGRALVGSAEDESVRQFFNAVPLHPVETHDFFIARTETTYADYLTFLRALSPEMRRLRTPQVNATGLHGSLRLGEDAGRWTLELRPGARIYRAAEGEKVRYPGRTYRGEQDWLRLPVTGVSYEDAIAYVRWLAKSGRVPGARLCTEAEWERAGRGADDRLYPHGDRLDPDDANFDLTYQKDPLAFGPDEVGSHPASRSPFDVDDLVGNVWEWVTPAEDSGSAVARGGSYYFASSSCRLNNRELPERSLRDLTVGLRVCADVPQLPFSKGSTR